MNAATFALLITLSLACLCAAQKGQKGEPGDRGPQGPSGGDGLPGIVGRPGRPGFPGPPGPRGSVGEQGIQGEHGIQGNPGTRPTSPANITVAVGPRGPPGFDGERGYAGPPGPQGARGPPGATGFPGLAGRTGIRGIVGFKGAAGSQGERGMQGRSGVSFIVWGAESCPGRRRELYSGLTTYGLSPNGSTTSYSCFPNRVEYHPLPLTSTGAQLNRIFQDENLPCLRCLANNAAKVVTVPGTFLCPDGWTLEYSGYLGTDSSAAMGSERYVCLHAESKSSGHAQSSVRGLLNDPALYDEERDLTCTVCTA